MVMEAEKSHSLKNLQAGDSGKQVSLSPISKAELTSEEPLSEGLSFTQIKPICLSSHFSLHPGLQQTG